MSRENLESKTRKELRVIATELEITGRWDMTKTQLIDAILKAKDVKVDESENVTILEGRCMWNGVLMEESAEDEHKVDNHETTSVEVENKVENESANAKINMEQKMSYIENIDIGTILAFRLSNGKVKSAKVTRKSTKNRKLKVETDYGAEYIIAFEDVIWVRTGKRWPRGVYQLLKGQVDANGKEKIKA